MAGNTARDSRLSATASKSTTKMAKGEEVNWRKEVDQNIKRLQSLLFGADNALESRDFAAAEILSLRLIGFLESRCRNDIDEAFIQPIRRQAFTKLDIARRALTAESDRQAFEAAGRAPDNIFSRIGDIDVDKIKQSKYFRILLQQSNKRQDQCCQEDSAVDNKQPKAKPMSNSRPAPLIGKNVQSANSILEKKTLNSRSNNSDDCIIVEQACVGHVHPKGFSSNINTEEEGRIPGHNLGAKRLHKETRSPRNEWPKSPPNSEEANCEASGNGFVTARTKLEMDAKQRRGLVGSPCASVSPHSDNNSAGRGYGMRSYGVPRRGIRGSFIPPIRSNGSNTGNLTARASASGKDDDALDDSMKRCLEMLCAPDGELPEKLRNLEPRLIEHVSNEIMDRDPNVRWNDIAGLDHAKKCVTEMVVWPLLRPDIFKGCRAPGRGLLLFGPPGTGKTMIGKAIAGEAKATFFYISASSLTSKWIGEGEKLVRALFGVASCRQPAVIFVDEIDSLLSQRKSDGEHEASRRLKTQFLIEMEGFDSGTEQILLIGATNRPQELDEAARRRLTKRLYIPLPSSEARAWIIRNLLEKDGLFELSKEDISNVCKLTEGYSGSDMKNLVKDASMGPLRDALRQGIEITKLNKEDMRPVILQDFKDALQEVRPSVSVNELGVYEDWNKQFGSLSL
ncbi:Fidgetin-like protein 1 [Dionaea muscipula]